MLRFSPLFAMELWEWNTHTTDIFKGILDGILKASTSPIIGYGGGGGSGTNGSAAGTAGFTTGGSPRNGSGPGLWAALLSDHGGVLEGESL